MKWFLGTLIALTSLSAVWFFELPGDLMLFPAILLATGAGLRPDIVLRVPAWVWRLGFPVLVATVVLDYLINNAVLEALLRLNILLITLRAVSPRKKRDDLQLLVLCLFLVVMAGVLTVSLGFVLLILVFAAGGLGFMFLVTLCESAGEESDSADRWTHASWGAVLGRFRAVADWRMFGISVAMFLAAIAMTSVFFLAIPRFEFGSSLGFLGLSNKRSLTGFSDTVGFGDVTDIKQDDSTALRVEVSNPDSVPANPYWRMVVLDSYEGGRFRVSIGARGGEDTSRRNVYDVSGTLPASGGDVQWTFYLEAGVSRYLPLTGRFSAMRLRDPAMVIVNPSSNIVSLTLHPQKMFAYRVDGMEPGGRIPEPGLANIRVSRAAISPESGGQRRTTDVDYPATLLQLAVTSEEKAVLERAVDEITGGQELSAVDFSRRALAYLFARHAYSLQSALPGGTGDPLVRWIAANGPGHCEFFAGAFTLLARTAGHRTRVVTGFSGGTWNAFEGYFMVRNSDAHAWCEIYDGEDWLRVDPTPGASGVADLDGGNAGAFRSSDRSWTAYIDSLRVIWYRRVVNFDQQQQFEVADAVKTLSRRSGERLLRAAVIVFERIEAWIRRPWDWGRITRTGLAVLILSIGVTAVWRTRGRWWGKLWLSRRGDPIRARAGVWLVRLRKADALRDDPEVTSELQRLRFGPAISRGYPVELFSRASAVVRRTRKRRQERTRV